MSTLKTAMAAVKTYAGLSLPYVITSQIALWGIYCVTKRNALIDCAWVFNHFLIGTSIATGGFLNLAGVTANPKNAITLLLLGLWTARLGGHLLTERVLTPYTDARYVQLMKRGGERGHYIKFLVQYLLQGILTCFCAFPLYFALSPSTAIGAPQILGWSLALIGIVGEAIADNQLKEYKKRGDKGGILREGLWTKSRHPNLFFEVVTWFGFAIAGIDSIGGLSGLIGPIGLYLVMNYVTIPITERSMQKTRPNWKEYVRETNKFLPF